MAFTTWAAFRSDLKDKIADAVSNGTALTQTAVVSGMTIQYKSLDEAIGWIEKSYKMEALDNIGNPSNMVSYGRHRRIR